VDPTTRRLHLPGGETVLVSDTVGFRPASCLINSSKPSDRPRRGGRCRLARPCRRRHGPQPLGNRRTQPVDAPSPVTAESRTDRGCGPPSFPIRSDVGLLNASSWARRRRRSPRARCERPPSAHGSRRRSATTWTSKSASTTSSRVDRRLRRGDEQLADERRCRHRTTVSPPGQVQPARGGIHRRERRSSTTRQPTSGGLSSRTSQRSCTRREPRSEARSAGRACAGGPVASSVFRSCSSLSCAGSNRRRRLELGLTGTSCTDVAAASSRPTPAQAREPVAQGEPAPPEAFLRVWRLGRRWRGSPQCGR